MCQSRLTHGLVQPFTRLYNGSWVFAALNQQVREFVRGEKL